MATTKSDFYVQTSASVTLKGTTVAAGPKIYVASEDDSEKLKNAGQQGAIDTPISFQSSNLGNLGLAKNGAVLLSLVSTTPQSIDFTDTTAATPKSTAGDTAFASVSQLFMVNHGGGTVTVSIGGSNGLGFLGYDDQAETPVTPTYVIPSGMKAILAYDALTVDGSHNTLTFTPSATCLFSVAVGGA